MGFVEVYVMRRRGRRVEFLVLRRGAAGWLRNVWQPVTGGLRRGERAVAGAVRELREETGLAPRRLWRLEHVTQFLDPDRDRICVVSLFAAEVAPDARVRLSAEHSAYRFVTAREAAKRFLWDSQRRGLAEVRAQVLRGGARAHALAIEVPRAQR
jgi:dATP pyrophosphohydrolase